MYYSFSCSYCSKVFYTYQDHKETAARILYEGIKTHLIEYDEDRKEYQFDEDPSIEIDQMYYALIETEDDPRGDYQL
ncbi:MAG TPA: hypothetical protein VG917_02225 [Patescibacteria group bacterium]|nr:hypothetical protein [Patescibacteria group bacterium]